MHLEQVSIHHIKSVFHSVHHKMSRLEEYRRQYAIYQHFTDKLDDLRDKGRLDGTTWYWDQLNLSDEDHAVWMDGDSKRQMPKDL
jgi:hypothetical protein